MLDLVFFQWEIKLRRVHRRTFFVPSKKEENQDEFLVIKKFVLLSCESSIIDSSSPVKAGVTVLLLRYDVPVKILDTGFGLRDSG